jgi:hypothetical protein
VTDQHPTVPTWIPEPPPPPARRRLLGPGLVAGLIAVVVLFGGVGLFAARQTASTAAGAASPEAAATGLLNALASQDLNRAARYLDGEEALLVATYRDRITDALARQVVGPTSPNGKPVSGVQLTARDIRFQRVAGLGGADVAVVELAGGTLGGQLGNGAKLELPATDVNRRLSEQTKGAIKAVRVVTVRSGDRWKVSLLASAAEQARLAAGAAEPDWDQLAASQPVAAGAASPEAAARDLVAALGRGQQAVLQQLSPAERRVLAAYRPLLDRPELMSPATGTVRVEGLQTSTEQVADDVARVKATAGRLVGPKLPQALTLDKAAANGQAPSVVTIRQDGTWYPSLVFSVTDWMLTRAERERP